jgi:glycosyltransferase involved in cell wall biosynthesis
VIKETDSIRIVHLAPTPFGLAGLFGGGERYPLELARSLARDVECDLVTFGPNPGVVYEPSGLRIRTLTPVRYLGGHPAHPLPAALLGAIGQADIVHTHQMRSTPSRLAAVACRAMGKQVVVTDHGLGGGGWGGLLPRLFHRFLTVSQHSADLLAAPPEKTRVIYGGADPDRFHPDPADVRSGVLFVGRLTPHKGVDRLITALPTDAELTCVGTGGHDRQLPESGYGTLLRHLATGRRVGFLDAVPDDELPLLYRRAQVFVLPSVDVTCYGRRIAISELLGLSMLEAMASGTPVICSRLGGLPEVVRDGETGFLVTPGDVGELRDRLCTLLGDRRLALRMGRAARETVLERFTWSACAARCLAEYDELLGQDTGAR